MRIVVLLGLGFLPTLLAQQQVGVRSVTAPPPPQPSPTETTVKRAARQWVDRSNAYRRVLAIVPLTGAGTHDDPKRPMFAPEPSAQTDRAGIIAYQQLLSDDGNLALVEFVAGDRKAFASLFASTDSRVKVFEVGQHSQQEIEAAFKQAKASFSFTNFQPLPVQ